MIVLDIRTYARLNGQFPGRPGWAGIAECQTAVDTAAAGDGDGDDRSSLLL